MANITLGERLAACASLVRRDAFLCDVGQTMHTCRYISARAA